MNNFDLIVHLILSTPVYSKRINGSIKTKDIAFSTIEVDNIHIFPYFYNTRSYLKPAFY